VDMSREYANRHAIDYFLGIMQNKKNKRKRKEKKFSKEVRDGKQKGIAL
jgi:hypothetical protein